MTDRKTWEVGEPALDELLSDPIVDCLLRRDGLTRHDVWRAVEAARDNLRADAMVADAAA